MNPLVPFLLAVWPAWALSPDPPAVAGVGGKVCAPDWDTGRKGGCWAVSRVSGDWAYVHSRGWMVDRRCLGDLRFTATEFLAALDAAYKKLSPTVPVQQGGCLSAFNPAWASELHDAPWRNHVYIACGLADTRSKVCATHEKADGFRELPGRRQERFPGYFRVIRIQNALACMGPDSTGLSGILFHETLHAADVDNVPTETHNRAWELPQYKFVYDHVYGAESVCYYGTDERKRHYSNFLQCLFVTKQAGQEAKRDLCRLFPSSYTDVPAAFFKH